MPPPIVEQEPVLTAVLVDMSTVAERTTVNVGVPIYSLFVDLLAPGTTLMELEVNGQWIPLQQGDTVFFGDCNPTLRGLKVRTAPVLAGLFSRFITGGTPDSAVERG